MATYREFLRTVTPAIIGMRNASVELHRTAYRKSRKLRTERILSSSYKLERVETDYFDMSVRFEFVIRAENESAEEVVPLRMSCVFEGHFHAKAPFETKNAQAFVDDDAWIVFWPYFRQFVSDTTARMSIPPEVLPLALGPGEITRRDRPDLESTSKPKITDGKEKSATRVNRGALKRGRGETGKRSGL